MKFNKNYVLCAALCLSLTGACILGNLKLRTAPSATYVADSFKQSCIEKLDLLETATWQHMEAQMRITQQQCCAEHAIDGDVDAHYIGEGAPLSDDVKQIIIAILHDFNVDPETIRILPMNDKSPAAALATIILINEELFRKLSPCAQKFVIAHELHHIMYKDWVAKQSLGDILQTDAPPQEKNSPVNELFRFHEYRADMYAALKNREYAQGYVEFITEMINVMGENAGITHPKCSQRLALAHQILAAYDDPTQPCNLELA